MRLMDTHTGRFVEKDPRKKEFKYAILSHTWDAEGEQTHQKLQRIQKRYASEIFPAENCPVPGLSAIWQDRDLSPKVRDACRVARVYGYRYIWIDSCCIDKTSSSELSEAINSMYAWYEGADVCYAYLADVPFKDVPYKEGSAFRGSRWFTRGWTLQELLAPRRLIFFSKCWMPLGSREEFAELVNTITEISVHALTHRRSLSEFSIGQRFSWAARRETTRVEDRAYSLLGIFDINMPTLYGEGQRAFQRIQEEILRRIPDQSIFTWGNVHPGDSVQILQVGNSSLAPGPLTLEDYSQPPLRVVTLNHAREPLLSPSPAQFVDGQNIEVVALSQLFYHFPDLPAPDYSFTPHGIRTHIPLIPLADILPDVAGAEYGQVREQSKWYLAVLGCEHVDHPGHLLGRVCCLHSSMSGINVLFRGAILFNTSSPNHLHEGGVPLHFAPAELVALSAEALVRFSPLATVLPVYLSNSHQMPMFSSDGDTRNHGHKTINLVLKKNHEAPYPRARNGGYSNGDEYETTLTLRWPDKDNPNTHWLTIFRPTSRETAGDIQGTITIEYTHMLNSDGNGLTIKAQVHVSAGRLQGYPILPVDDTITWNDWRDARGGWLLGDRSWKWYRPVTLDNGKGGKAIVGLSMEYLSLNHYVIDARIERYMFSRMSSTVPIWKRILGTIRGRT